MADRPRTAARPGTAAVRITGSALVAPRNPRPQSASDDVIEEYLSENKLQTLSGLQDLSKVTFLELKVDTTENSLGRFGSLVPNLQQLKLSNSVIASVRDLGTTLTNLRVLWMARCGLQDLDGIGALYSLKELYLAFNDIQECSALNMLDQLESLDLEGNKVTEFDQIEFLGLCRSLSNLTLSGNPVCEAQGSVHSYRQRVFAAMPSLRLLDDQPLGRPRADLDTLGQDAELNVVQESLKLQRDPHTGVGRPKTAGRPLTAGPGRPGTARPGTAGGRSSGVPGHIEALPQDDPDGSSSLTQGSDVMFCGSPLKALMARRNSASSSLSSATAGAATDPGVGLEDLMRSVGLTLDDDDDDEAEDDQAEGLELSREELTAELTQWGAKFSRFTEQLEHMKDTASDGAAPEVLVLGDSDEEKESPVGELPPRTQRRAHPPRRSRSLPKPRALPQPPGVSGSPRRVMPQPPGARPSRPKTSTPRRGSLARASSLRPTSGPVRPPPKDLQAPPTPPEQRRKIDREHPVIRASTEAPRRRKQPRPVTAGSLRRTPSLPL
eukprot:m.477256 g.477256  ORF g.477256 m.477256 type:complete len:552 (+) comp20796_c0_seq1:152-1807(+)